MRQYASLVRRPSIFSSVPVAAGAETGGLKERERAVDSLPRKVTISTKSFRTSAVDAAGGSWAGGGGEAAAAEKGEASSARMEVHRADEWERAGLSASGTLSGAGGVILPTNE